MWFKKETIIPTAREASLRTVMEGIEFELDNGKRIRKETAALREVVAQAVNELIQHPRDSVEIVLAAFLSNEDEDGAFEPSFHMIYSHEAIQIVMAELEALGYVVFGEAGMCVLNIALPLPKFPAAAPSGSALRLVK